MACLFRADGGRDALQESWHVQFENGGNSDQLDDVDTSFPALNFRPELLMGTENGGDVSLAHAYSLARSDQFRPEHFVRFC